MIPIATGLILIALHWIEHRTKSALGLLGALAFVGLLCDRSNVMSVALVAGFLALEGFRTRERHVASVALVLLVASLGWVATSSTVHDSVIGVSTQIAVTPTPEDIANQHVAAEFQKAQPTARQIWANLTRFLTPLTNPYIPTNMNVFQSDVAIDLLNQLGIAAVAGLSLLGLRLGRSRSLLIATWVLMFTGPLVAWYLYEDLGQYFLTNSRFAIGLCVGVAAAIGLLAERSKAIGYGVNAISIVASAAMVWVVATAPILAR